MGKPKMQTKAALASKTSVAAPDLQRSAEPVDLQLQDPSIPLATAQPTEPIPTRSAAQRQTQDASGNSGDLNSAYNGEFGPPWLFLSTSSPRATQLSTHAQQTSQTGARNGALKILGQILFTRLSHKKRMHRQKV